MPYTRATETTYAVCRKADGTATSEQVIFAVKFPDKSNWFRDTANGGRRTDWPAEEVFSHLEGCPVGTRFSWADAYSLTEQLIGQIFDFTVEPPRALDSLEIAARMTPLVGSTVVRELDNQ
jgi:hypothetical protein